MALNVETKFTYS